MNDDGPARNLVPAYGPPPPHSDVPAPSSAEPPRAWALRIFVAILAVASGLGGWWLWHR